MHTSMDHCKSVCVSPPALLSDLLEHPNQISLPPDPQPYHHLAHLLFQIKKWCFVYLAYFGKYSRSKLLPCDAAAAPYYFQLWGCPLKRCPFKGDPPQEKGGLHHHYHLHFLQRNPSRHWWRKIIAPPCHGSCGRHLSGSTLVMTLVLDSISPWYPWVGQGRIYLGNLD